MLAVLATAGPAAAMDGQDNGPAQLRPERAAVAAAVIGADWEPFSFGNVGSIVGPFEFTSDGAAILSVTDAFCRGDEFLVRDDGVTLGTTSESDSAAGCGGPTDVSDPDAAFSDATYSSGSWVVGSGTHSVIIEVIESPWEGGGAYFRVDRAPTPLTTADCKRDGWRQLYDNEGHVFRNQGACVSSVAGHPGGRP
jgi:hypothetical protein